MVVGRYFRQNRDELLDRRERREAVRVGVEKCPATVAMCNFYSVGSAHTELGIQSERADFAIPDSNIDIVGPECGLLLKAGVELGDNPEALHLDNIERRKMQAGHKPCPAVLVIEQDGIWRHAVARIHIRCGERITVCVLIVCNHAIKVFLNVFDMQSYKKNLTFANIRRKI